MIRLLSRRGARAILCALTLVLGSGACSPSRKPLPPGPQVVDVVMREYSYDFDATALSTGRVEFRVRNAGRQPHRLALVFLPKDVPPIAEQVKGTKRRVVRPLADLPTMEPGRTNVFGVGLPAGRWAIACYVPGPDGRSHASMGMASEFRVAGTS